MDRLLLLLLLLLFLLGFFLTSPKVREEIAC